MHAVDEDVYAVSGGMVVSVMSYVARSGAMTGVFRHDALFYRDAAELVSAAVPFLCEAAKAGEPVLVAVPGHNIDIIRRALGPDAGLGGQSNGEPAGRRDGYAARFVDMEDSGRNPGRIIPFLLKAFAHEHPGRPVRIVCEQVWPGRTADEYAACLQHEVLVNAAFAGQSASVLCPYDVGRLSPGVVADARCTHPAVVADGIRGASDSYDVRRVTSALGVALPPPPERSAELKFDGNSPGSLRDFVAGRASSAGLGRDRVDDLMLAVNELVANTVRYGGGSGVLRIWDTRDHVVCEVSDGGRIADPLAGRMPAAPDSSSGRGLLIVNYLCDLVRLSTAGDATTVRVFMRR